MAQKLTLIDDIDGTPIDDGGGTFQFSVDGANFEIDLSATNADELREVFQKYTSVARRSRAATPTRATAGSKKDPQRLKAIREWAAQNGHEVSSRGRISADIQQAYDAAH
ncbi:hypothetical protein ASF48_17735 [Rathayibacter sp. Leaf299]|uniref:histone-like nucleoid-structuring protein Lsr2 n=1 Tax=Rathayibacter sp. Leaf299 TaxID=1736328 RepID=UPI0006F33CE2|nr:Lsr2 family protein [Rathayibacter sp. Leaf299]KQQ18759.1 hypothetical protein ASF48_17735 [Rathayibacter sp. Leaf299]